MKLDSCINLTFFILIVTLLSTNISCKEDKKELKSEEDIFLEDHYSPDKKWGYVNTAGRLAIEDKFDDCRDFSEKRAAVNYKGKWGFIDKGGGFVVEPVYREAYGYKNGYALVRGFDDVWLLLDTKANTKMRITADRVFLPNDGILRYQKQGIYAYLTLEGDTLTPKKFLRASDFNNATAIVKETDQDQLLNTNGEFVSEKYDKIYPLQGDVYRVKKEGKFAYLSSSGKLLNSKTYAQAFDYLDGHALVKLNKRYAVINATGKVLSNLDYELAEPAGEGIFRVFDGKHWGLVNVKGKLVADLEYEMFYNTAESHIAFSKIGLWGFMNLQGEIIREAKHPLVWDFKDGYARVIEARRGIGFIDTGGKMVIPPYFVDVRDFYENLARVQVY